MISKITRNQIFLLLIIGLFLSSCQKNSRLKKAEKSFIILSINDVYRGEGLDKGTIGGLARVKTIRDQLLAENKAVLLLHAGDFLQPSFSSRVNQGAAMIDTMNQLDGSEQGFDQNMIVTFGNHEFDKSKLKYLSRLQQRIDESDFNWLDSNINWLHDEKYGQIHSNKMHKWIIKDIAGIKVGLYSLTTNMTQPEYVASFDDPTEVTQHYVPFLRNKGADVVIALTHQQLSDDKKVMSLADEFRPDIIIGGHEHYHQLVDVNKRWIIKADADAASAAVIQVTLDKDKKVHFLPTIKQLDDKVAKNPQVQQTVENWIQKTDLKYCQKIKQNSNCLEQAYGTTQVDLIAEESEIRRFETNMGDFIADTALHEFNICHADVALINSGSVRLNYNIAADSNITRKHIEGMFPYPSDLQQIQINGRILKQIITHSIDKWTANGHWLLVSGIRFVHNPETQSFSQLKWVKNNKPINDDETITVVVPNYLISAHTDHDGYEMINESMIVNCSKNGANLKQLVINKIKQSSDGIAPKKDGRICNTMRDKCLP